MVSIDIVWKQYLWDCYHHGHNYKKDDSEVRELLGNYVFLERPQDIGIPFKRKIDTAAEFIQSMKKGLYNIVGYPIKNDALADYVCSISKPSHIFCSDTEFLSEKNLDEEKTFVYTYPERLIHTKYNNDSDEIDFKNQIFDIEQRLRENNGSNRGVATLYHPGIDYNRVDIPCLNWLQGTIRNNGLELHCMFRSNDLYGAWPSNMYFLTHVGLIIAEALEQPFYGIHYHSSSLHIYKTDLPAVKKILE